MCAIGNYFFIILNFSFLRDRSAEEERKALEIETKNKLKTSSKSLFTSSPTATTFSRNRMENLGEKENKIAENFVHQEKDKEKCREREIEGETEG